MIERVRGLPLRRWLTAPMLVLAACAGVPTTSPVPIPAATVCGVRERPATALPDLPAIDTVPMRAHTRVLAHDSLGGRGTASPGALGAARYIARQLEAMGARPVTEATGDRSPYLLPVPLLRSDVSDATLTITTTTGGSTRLRHGSGFIVGRIGREGMHAAAGPVARVTADSAEVARGSWLLLAAPLGEAALRWVPTWKLAGVVGLVIRLPSDAAVSAYHRQLGDVRWQLREGDPDPVWQPDLPVVMAAPGVAEALSTGSAHLDFDPRARSEAFVDYNVAGIVGDDGPTPRTLVAMTAHYDHLGTTRGAPGEDTIFNGFSDNAAGVAMLLAIGASAAHAPPALPLLLLFPGAEETGLLGSLHFVREHRDLARRVHALVNVDAGAPPAPPTRWRLAGGTRSWAGAVAAAAVEARGWTHRSDPGSPNSDHWPFIALGVPAVFLIPDGAYEGVDDAGAERLRARWDRYHQLDDEWSVDFPFAGLGRYALLGRDIAWRLAAVDAPCP